MNFTSQICTTKEQSEKLLALGLKRETADCILVKDAFKKDHYLIFPIVDVDETLENEMCDEPIPAWSLNRLIEMIPTVITHEDYSLILGINSTCVYYADDEYAETFKAFEGNLYECVVKCIDWLIKDGYFNKEYLEK